MFSQEYEYLKLISINCTFTFHEKIFNATLESIKSQSKRLDLKTQEKIYHELECLKNAVSFNKHITTENVLFLEKNINEILKDRPKPKDTLF